jgi:hypothetical protein
VALPFYLERATSAAVADGLGATTVSVFPAEST